MRKRVATLERQSIGSLALSSGVRCLWIVRCSLSRERPREATVTTYIICGPVVRVARGSRQ